MLDTETEPRRILGFVVGRTTPVRTLRYQMGNHLGSVALELDEKAEVISYEEYHPYGTTAYQAQNSAMKAAAKRYRYTGMERDKETGLEYHSARYYVVWLGRWGSCDPIGTSDTLNVYSYTKGTPLTLNDPKGQQGMSPPVLVQREILQYPVSDFIDQKKKEMVSAWNKFRLGITQLFISEESRENYDRMKEQHPEWQARPTTGVDSTGPIVEQTPMAAVNAMTALAGGIGPKPPAAPKLPEVPKPLEEPIIIDESQITSGKLSRIPVYKPTPGGQSKSIPTSELQLTQTSVGQKANVYREMVDAKNATFPPLDVVEMQGAYKTLDNTRSAVLIEAGEASVQATVHQQQDLLPENMLGRFGESKTWGEAVQFRESTQKGSLPAKGELPQMPPRKPQ